MGVYIKKLQAKKVEAIFAMLGLHIEDGDIIEVKIPHGRLIDENELLKRCAIFGTTKLMDAVIESEDE